MTKRMNLLSPLCAVLLSIAATVPEAQAQQGKNQAARLCEQKMTERYGLDSFRDVWVDQTGNRSFEVHGKAKYERQRYPFECRIKNGYVKSYYYNGPHRAHESDDDSKLGTALAVGAGLAIIAALASKGGDAKDDDYYDFEASTDRDAELLEDDCYDELAQRMRHEHREHVALSLQSKDLRGRTLSGEGIVRWAHHPKSRFEYTCFFDGRGHIRDSEYHYY